MATVTSQAQQEVTGAQQQVAGTKQQANVLWRKHQVWSCQHRQKDECALKQMVTMMTVTTTRMKTDTDGDDNHDVGDDAVADDDDANDTVIDRFCYEY